MLWIRNFCVVVILIGLVDSCTKQPEYSVVPEIQVQNITLKHEYPAHPDTLIFQVKFTDGDGDLGVNGDETAIYTSSGDSTDINTPFYFVYDTTQNSIWYYTHSNTVSLPPKYVYVNYTAKLKIPTAPFDTLPDLSCKNWELRPVQAPGTTYNDNVLYIQTNSKYYNFLVDVYFKDASGNYVLFDPSTYFAFGNQCVTNLFNGRFPILSTDLGKKSPLDGVLTYKVQSAALYLLLHGKTVKFKIRITDRAFHTSNITETEITF